MMKKKMAALVMAFFLGGSAMTSFAFNTEAEATAVANGEEGLYTAYSGAPLSEVMDNFHGLSGWSCKVNAPMASIHYERKNSKTEEWESHVQKQSFTLFAHVGQDTVYERPYFPEGDWSIEGYSSSFYMNNRRAFTTMRDGFFDTFHQKYGESYLVKKFSPTIYYTFWRMQDGRVAAIYVFDNERQDQYIVGVYYVTNRFVASLLNTD